MSSPEFHDLLSLCSSAAAKHGGRIAAQHGPRRISYAELLACAKAFGAHLRLQGLGPGEFAVLQMENSLEYMVALFGIFAAGAIAVPVNFAASGAYCSPAFPRRENDETFFIHKKRASFFLLVSGAYELSRLGAVWWQGTLRLGG